MNNSQLIEVLIIAVLVLVIIWLAVSLIGWHPIEILLVVIIILILVKMFWKR